MNFSVPIRWRSWAPSLARFVPITVALASGIAATLLAADYMTTRIASTEAEWRARYVERPVVVAARTLQPGESLAADDVAVRQVPTQFVPSDAVAPGEVDTILGAVTAHPLERGDPIQRSTITDGLSPSLAQLVSAERRAVTLAVDELSGFAGLLAPGDSLDLLYIADPGLDGEVAPVVRPLFEAVPVLATGRATRAAQVAGADGAMQEVQVDYATVALELSALDAERLALAQKTGEITALLRHPADRASGALSTVRVDALHGRAPPRPASRSATVEIIVGGSRSGAPVRVASGG